MKNKPEYIVVKKEIKDNISSDNNSGQFWKEEGEDIAHAVFSQISQIQENQYGIWYDSLKYAALYENFNYLHNVRYSPFFNRSFDFSNSYSSSRSDQNQSAFNVIKSCIDSLKSKVTKDKPAVQFVTDNGDPKQQTKAKQLTKYIDGVFEDINAYKLGELLFRDACVFGIGALKVLECDGLISVERVIVPAEIIVDETDAMNGKPTFMHQCKPVNKDKLLELYKDDEEKLQKIHATSILQSDVGTDTNMIMITESWHLPSTNNSNDGKHVICVDGCVLLEEDYKKDYFPFVFYRYSERIQSFFGGSLAEELANIQYMINYTLQMIRAGQKVMAMPRWFIQENSIANDRHFPDNMYLKVRPGAQLPQPLITQSIGSDIYAWLQTLIDKAYEMSGVSQLSASSQIPRQLESGVAIQNYQDINTERFANVSLNYRDCFVTLANIIVDMSCDLFSESTNVKNKYLKEIDWKEFKESQEQDLYTVTTFPVSAFPTQPAAKLDMVVRFMQAGILSPNNAIDLFDLPDIDNFFSMSTASKDYINYTIQKIIDDKEPQEIDNYVNLELALEITTATILRQKMSPNKDEEVVELLEDYLTQINDRINELMKQQQQQQMQQPQDVPMPEENIEEQVPEQMAEPLPPPESDLLPI